MTERMESVSRDTRINSDMSEITEHYLPVDELDISLIEEKTAEYLSDMYCAHRFDLLGSGWVMNSYTSESLGVEGYRYSMNLNVDHTKLPEDWLNLVLLEPHTTSAKRIWSHVDATYVPIDWQKDYKSGYRWDAKSWYKDIKYGNKLGADVKVPWELARFQHLPQLAIFSLVLRGRQTKLIREFRNQVLDFIATNPPRMGVNWVCTMDVSIRAVNMLLAFDMFSQIDSSGILNQEFKQCFANSIYEHGSHIISNLEWSKDITSNHYLSNIAGLTFIAAYLNRTPEVDCWLAFSIQELIQEYGKQFYLDGGNFESSTSYHRLSGELIVYATAIILGLSNEKRKALYEYDLLPWHIKPVLRKKNDQIFNVNDLNLFPAWYRERLYHTIKFTLDITKPTGEIPQIGDNDSGRFVRLSPNGKFLSKDDVLKKYKNLSGYQESDPYFWEENDLKHNTFTAAINALFRNCNDHNAEAEFPLEFSIVSALTKHVKFETDDFKNRTNNILLVNDNDILSSSELPFKSEEIIRPRNKDHHSLISNMRLMSYQNSGIYIYKSDRVYLSIAIVPKGQNGLAGHNHNDIGSFDLNIDSEDVIVDPGSYIYTPLPQKRNLFRSGMYHSIPVIKNQDQYLYNNQNLFTMWGNPQIKILSAKLTEFKVQVSFRKIVMVRKFSFYDDHLMISDSCSHMFSLVLNRFDLYSNGYGKRVK